MATLALAAVGTVIGGAAGSFSLLGMTITGAAIGRTVGAIAGSYVDQLLFGASGQASVASGSSRLSDLTVTASTEGNPIPKIYGQYCVGGQIIWATDHEEEVRTTSFGGGGKGGSGSSGSTTTSYFYYANFAVALCEGEISSLGRVWANGEEFDLTMCDYRLYKGTETQTVDPLIEANEGTNNAPAYRGVSYIVFERFPLSGDFGNHIPQFKFEIFKAVDTFDEDIRGVSMIPSAGEFVYHTSEVRVDGGAGTTYSENRHMTSNDSNFMVSLDQLEEQAPNCQTVSLFVSWFGEDLRCANCTIKPKVETSDKGTGTTPISWGVSGLTRSTADVVTEYDGDPAYGGTPSDQTVIAAITELKSRGYTVIYTPFILMDIEQGNTLPNPYDSGATYQGAYPWRGRITCYPAPGEPSTPDKTAAAQTQVDSFVGTATPSDFSIVGGAVVYSGPNEWTYSRFIYHNAMLCSAAGGVDAFVIGSEMRGLTWVRDSASTFPFVDALVTIASDVTGILSSAEITYAADWSEYFGYQPSDGSNDVYFHLDPLWADSNIDAIGIDVYWPMADWRDGVEHLDYLAGYTSVYDTNYLQGNLKGGENYSWYYASDSDRDDQTRTTITDGLGKPWVFRAKDIWNWWSNSHYNRPGGVESGTPTSWTAESKPIWFTEIGCGAIDKGANQPNVFYDPKSSESYAPYYSRETRDDLMQRSLLRSVLNYFDPSDPDFVSTNNPISGVYSDRMVDIDRIMLYTWDARPYPVFPRWTSVWADGSNWYIGHWLNGRVSSAPLDSLVESILDSWDFNSYDVTALQGSVQGYCIDSLMTAKDALQPLELACFFDSYESGGEIKFRHKGAGGSVATLDVDSIVDSIDKSDSGVGLDGVRSKASSTRYTLTRGQETELPQSVKITYSDLGNDYKTAVAEARKQVGYSLQETSSTLAMVLNYSEAAEKAAVWLHEVWTARDALACALPPSKLALEPTDVITFSIAGKTTDTKFRITRNQIGESQTIEGQSIEPHIYDRFVTPEQASDYVAPTIYGQAFLAFMDLPIIFGTETDYAGRLAVFADPWPGSVAVYRSPNTSDYTLNVSVSSISVMGTLQTDLNSGTPDIWDYANTIRVEISSGELTSASVEAVLNGANLIAVENADEEWELIQFCTATLVSGTTYDLTKLLRGQYGTEGAMRDPVSSGAKVVVITATSLTEVQMSQDEIGIPYYWKYGPSPYAIDNETYQTETRTFEGVGLRPYSPVDIDATFDGSNNLDITWIRRTRYGDSWSLTVEPPLNEQTEAYEIDIYDGASIVRTLTATTTTVQYTSAQQTADFGSVQSSYVVRVFQMSASFGRGQGRTETVPR